MVLEDNMFGFIVEDENGSIIATGTNRADGAITFGAIGFTAPGDYSYTVSEISGGTSGITYDNTLHRVNVTVAESSGTLTATPSYPSGGIVFNNIYATPSVNSVSVSPKTATIQRRIPPL